jgi:hypothetical protein
MLLAEVLKHVVLPRIGFAATRFGAYKATAGCKRLMTLAVPFQICVRVEGAGAAVMVASTSFFMFTANMCAGVEMSVRSLQSVWDDVLTSSRMYG